MKPIHYIVAAILVIVFFIAMWLIVPPSEVVFTTKDGERLEFRDDGSN